MKKYCYFLAIIVISITAYSCKKDASETELIINSDVLKTKLPEFLKNHKPANLSEEDKTLRNNALNSSEVKKIGQLESRSINLFSPIAVEIQAECTFFQTCFTTSHLTAYLADKDGNELGTLYSPVYGPSSKILYNLPVSNNQYELNIHVSSYSDCTTRNAFRIKVSSTTSASKYFYIPSSDYDGIQWHGIDIIQPGYIISGTTYGSFACPLVP